VGGGHPVGERGDHPPVVLGVAGLEPQQVQHAVARVGGGVHGQGRLAADRGGQRLPGGLPDHGDDGVGGPAGARPQHLGALLEVRPLGRAV